MNEERTAIRHEFETDKGIFVYDFNEMTMDRILQAMMSYRIEIEIEKHLPRLPSEVDIAIERRTSIHAFAALLMKKTAQGYEDYLPASNSGFDALKLLKGKKNFDALMECKLDFFYNSGLSVELSTQQSKEQMKSVLEIVKGMNGEQLNNLFQLIGLSAGTNTGDNITNKLNIGNVLENLITGE